MFDTLTRMGASAAGAYEIERSLMFNSADSALLTYTPSGDGNRKKFTFSFWVKKGLDTTSGTQGLFSAYTGSGTDRMTIFAGGSLQLEINPNKGEWRTTRLLRDPSAWYNIVVQKNTTLATANDRVKIWVNGVEETDLTRSTTQVQNEEDFFLKSSQLKGTLQNLQ